MKKQKNNKKRSTEKRPGGKRPAGLFSVLRFISEGKEGDTKK